MKNLIKITVAFLLINMQLIAAPIGTQFSYQGQLQTNGSPANGVYDFQMELWSSLTGGTSVSPTLTLEDVDVANGLFSVELDFGDVPFDGDVSFLKIQVREGASTGAFAELAPRQRVSTVPYAIQADFLAANGANTGQVLKFDGSNWVAGTDDTGPASPWLETSSYIQHVGNVLVGTSNATPTSKMTINSDLSQHPLTVQSLGTTTFVLNTNGGASIGSGALSPSTNGLRVVGNSIFQSDSTVRGDFSVEGDSTIKGNAVMESDATINGVTLMKGNVNVEGNFKIGNNSILAPAEGIYIEGEAKQAFNTHGFVKAGTVIRCGSGISGGSQRFFNNLNVDDFATSSPGGVTGICEITTPFTINSAFYTVSAVAIGGVGSGVLTVNCAVSAPSKLYCQIINSFGSAQNGELQIIVY